MNARRFSKKPSAGLARARRSDPPDHPPTFAVFHQVFGLSLAEFSILLLPLDVANRAACAESIVLSACNFALPMLDLWYAVYMIMIVWTLVVVPFTLFYYEQDHDTSVYGKVVSSFWWVAGAFAVVALIVGLCYGFLGFVDLPVSTVVSGVAGLGSAALSAAHRCVSPESGGASSGFACDAAIRAF